MRATLIALFLLACQGDPSTMNARIWNHSNADRASAMKAVSTGLDAAFLWLKEHPADQAGALAHARQQLAQFYTADEADAFRLHVAGGELMLYLPPDDNHLTIWLGRTENHLIVEPSGLTPEARAKVGQK